MPVLLTIEYASAVAFLSAFEAEIRNGSLSVPGSAPAGTTEFAECTVAVRVGHEPAVEVAGWVGSILPGVNVGVLLGGGGAAVSALGELAERIRNKSSSSVPIEELGPNEAAQSFEDSSENSSEDASEESDEAEAAGNAPPVAGTVFARIAALTVTEKMRLALSGGRDERQALLRDLNKTLHAYVLRNPRIGLDEVQWASKQTNLSPEALKQISEHPQWGADSTVAANIVRNPKTPVTIAIRLLDKLSASDVRAIARGGARQPIVAAARRMLNI